jgi:hypothetical protein
MILAYCCLTLWYFSGAYPAFQVSAHASGTVTMNAVHTSCLIASYSRAVTVPKDALAEYPLLNRLVILEKAEYGLREAGARKLDSTIMPAGKS